MDRVKHQSCAVGSPAELGGEGVPTGPLGLCAEVCVWHVHGRLPRPVCGRHTPPHLCPEAQARWALISTVQGCQQRRRDPGATERRGPVPHTQRSICHRRREDPLSVSRKASGPAGPQRAVLGIRCSVTTWSGGGGLAAFRGVSFLKCKNPRFEIIRAG